MAAADNLHSQLVGWTKILLPLLALALLSTLFLFARHNNDAETIPFAEIDEMARDQRITAPAFSGVSDEGAIIAVGAEFARPDDTNADLLTIARPRLTIDAPDGISLRVTAGEGQLDTATRRASLTGLARLETSSGYTMETVGLDADLRTGEVVSHGNLAVQAPFGELEAGRVTIKWAESGEGQYLNFTDGVRLVYQPPRDEDASE